MKPSAKNQIKNRTEEQQLYHYTVGKIDSITRKTYDQFQPEVRRLIKRMQRQLHKNLSAACVPLAATTTGGQSWSGCPSVTVAQDILFNRIYFEYVMAKIRVSYEVKKKDMLENTDGKSNNSTSSKEKTHVPKA